MAKAEVKQAGPINLVTENNVHVSGCAVKMFFSVNAHGQPYDMAKEVEAFFGEPENRGLLVVQQVPLAGGQLLVYYKQPLDPDELEVLNLNQEVINKLVEQHRAERDEVQRKFEEGEAKLAAVRKEEEVEELAELHRLAALGRKWEKEHNKKGQHAD